MSDPKFIALTPELHDYVVRNGAREDDALAAVRESTAALGDIAVMQISPDQGALMTMLTRLAGATKAIELGTFTGYSAICIARGLEPGGRLTGSEAEAYDFAFIDADKTGYPGYYESCLTLLRPGGLIVLDNVLRGGTVLDPAADDEGGRVIAELNERIASDERVDVAMLAVADGITLARKR